ncbi:MAG: DUF305 domain-containing protein [Cryobacterium sp.]
MISVRTPLLAAAALAAALTLSACSAAAPATDTDTDTDSSSASDVFNSADVMFAQMMIPHHEQAVEMSDDLLAKDDIDEDIVALATEIKAAQQPEITQLQDWLIEWDAEAQPMSDMGDGSDGSDGMMTADDMMALQNASGAEAGELFLQQMTEHHEGAVVMAQVEVDDGAHADARMMAANIIETQTAEIATMAALLAAQ